MSESNRTANGIEPLPEDQRVTRILWDHDIVPMQILIPAIRELMNKTSLLKAQIIEPTEAEKFLYQVLLNVQIDHYPATIWPKDIEEFLYQIQS